jgi:hypothetical protein
VPSQPNLPYPDAYLVADHRTQQRRFLNPRSDARFARIVELLIEGADGPEDLEARLRRSYPDALVRERDLADEPSVWYVYRDGRWVNS